MSKQLANPVLEVTLTEGDEPITVRTTNADLVRWDMTRARNQWPTVEAGPFLWLTFMAWSAMKRTNQLPPEVTKWETFSAEIFAVTAETAEPVNPTQAGAVPEPD